MVCSLKDVQWNKCFRIIILLHMASLIQCFCDQGAPYFPVYYPKVGEFFIMDVGLREQYSWHKDDKKLALQTCKRHDIRNCTQPIYLVQGRADLNFKNITQEDSGKYILEVFCPGKRVSSFKVMVQNKPIVVSDCKDMTVKEGENITCVCTTTEGSSSAEVTWMRSKPYQENLGLKNSTGVLRLENISKNQSGTYSCFARSQDFANTTSFNLKVVSENYIQSDNGVEIAYFEAFQRIRGDHCKLIIICKARGIPEPSYIITHNETVVEYENFFTLDTKKHNSPGHYECLARNKHGSDRRSLLLNKNFLVGACNDNENDIFNNEMEWKLRIIVGVTSFLAGILLLCVFMCCCKKTKKKNDSNEEYDGNYDDVHPKSQTKGLGTRDKIAEMRLRYSPGRPGIEAERDSANYDIPELGN